MKFLLLIFFLFSIEVLLAQTSKARPAANPVMLQFFHWTLSNDGSHWNLLSQKAQDLARIGFTSVWLPPATKGLSGIDDVGYGLYDLYDLGEFDQKGSIRTKYGTKKEYLEAIQRAHHAGLAVYSDLNLNHMGGAEETEWVLAHSVNPENRLESLGPDFVLQAWTQFSFPARSGQYSKFQWQWFHFDATDRDENQKLSGIFQFRGEHKHWDSDVDAEKGNFDYLLMNDLDLEHPAVRDELIHWGRWVTKTSNVDGFRIDAAKHTSFDFTRQWLEEMQRTNQKKYFAVAEYWSHDLEILHQYLQRTREQVSLFDFILQDHLAKASKERGYYDLSQVFDGTVTKAFPSLSVTFTDNHDTQRHLPRFVQIESWFKPIAYALILLRRDGYPCVFYPDYFEDSKSGVMAIPEHLERLLEVRRKFMFGPQHDYFDDRDVVGWTREGNLESPKAVAVILSDSFREDDALGFKEMFVGKRPDKGLRTFKDITENFSETITVGSDGFGKFPVRFASEHQLGRSLSIWIEQ